MTLMLTEEHHALRDTLRSFFSSKSSEEEVRRVVATDNGHDAAMWKELCNLGLPGLLISEEHGGAGATLVDMGVVLEEAGRALVPVPLLSTAVLAPVLLQRLEDTAAQEEYLPRIASGELLVSVCFADPGGVSSTATSPVSAVQSGDGWTLSGTSPHVLDAQVAELLLVVANAPDGPGVFAVPAKAEGVVTHELTTLDLTRRQSRITFEGVEARRLGTSAQAADAVAFLHEIAATAMAMEQVGGIERLVEMASSYARERYQFGRAIGSFQAVKHRCADMLIKLELAKAAAYHALYIAVEEPAGLPAWASLAKATCSDAYAEAAYSNIMVHGGIGFTWEHPAHLYYRRAKSDQALFGFPAAHRDRVLRLQNV